MANWEGGGGGGGAKGGNLHLGSGGQEDGIAMKGVQSKVKWGANGGPMGCGVCDVNGGGGGNCPQTPHSYATGANVLSVCFCIHYI